MRSPASLTALLAALTTANAAYQGFNYGNTFTDGSAKSESDFESEFQAAASLAGTNGDFTSARLYTMIQAGTTNDPISAIPAAISTGTSLLFGLWASAGADSFANELEALRRAVEQYGDDLDSLVAGISVGSEDLYRNSPAGIESGSDPGTDPDTIVDYISQVRDALEGTAWSDVSVGHVDTWNAWTNGSNSAVIDACDWVGFNGFAYYEETESNPVSQGKALFDRAVGRTRNAVGDKPVWITETGWPITGDTYNEAVPSVENAETFYKDVGCPLFGETNTWWYLLRYSPEGQQPDFGVTGADLSTTPRYDLSCSGSGSSSGNATSSAVPESSETLGGGSGSGDGNDNGDGDDSGDGDDATPPVGGGNGGSNEGDREPQPSDGAAGDADDECPDDEYDGGQDGGEDDGAAGEDECPDDGADDGGVVPVPPPAGDQAEPTESVPIPPPGGDATGEVPAPTGGNGNSNGTIPEPSASAGSGGDADEGSTDEGAQGSGDDSSTDVDAASSMSFSAAFLAVMVAVAAF